MFLDAPKHFEFRADGIPLLREGDVVDFDLRVKEPDVRKPREVKGPYRVKRRFLKFSSGDRPSRAGFSQYLEVEPEERGPS